jgi:hypothetical protein
VLTITRVLCQEQNSLRFAYAKEWMMTVVEDIVHPRDDLRGLPARLDPARRPEVFLPPS